MESVTAGESGIVAVGWDDSGGDFDAAVWTTSDGFTWSRIPHDEAVFGAEGDQLMEGVAVGGPGFVAVGTELSGGGPDGAVWTSPDGITWSRVPHDEGIFGGPGFREMYAVAVGCPGLVAVGVDQSGDFLDAAAWTSPDGVTWSRVPHDVAVFSGGGDQVMRDLAAWGPAMVVVGYDADAEVAVDAAVWVAAPR